MLRFIKITYKDEYLFYSHIYVLGQKYRKKFLQAPSYKKACEVGTKWIERIKKENKKVIKYKDRRATNFTFDIWEDFVECSTGGVLVSFNYTDKIRETLDTFKRSFTTEDSNGAFWDVFNIFSFIKVEREFNDLDK